MALEMTIHWQRESHQERGAAERGSVGAGGQPGRGDGTSAAMPTHGVVASLRLVEFTRSKNDCSSPLPISRPLSVRGMTKVVSPDMISMSKARRMSGLL